MTTTDAQVHSSDTAPAVERAPELITPIVKATTTHSRRTSAGLRLVAPVIVFALWWLSTATGWIPGYILASPPEVIRTFGHLFAHQGLAGDILVSLGRALLGLAIGGVLGLILGTIVGLFALGEELLDSILQMLRTVPVPALIFLFIAWFGTGELPTVVLITMATFVPMYINTSNGVRNVDARIVEAARTFGLGGRALLQQVILPLSLPSILTGLRFSAGFSVIALVFAESLGSSSGIGYLLNQAAGFINIPVIMCCVMVYAALGIFIDLLVRFLERRLMPWRAGVAVR